jgi:hypothetical protein
MPLRNIIAILILILPAAAQSGDTVFVRLRQGGIVSGIVTSSLPEAITIRSFSDQEFTFARDMVSGVFNRNEFDSLSADSAFRPAPMQVSKHTGADWTFELLAGTAVNQGRGPGVGARVHVVTQSGLFAGGLVVLHPDLSSGRGPSYTGALSYIGIESGMSLNLYEYRLQPAVGFGAALVRLDDTDANRSNASGETVYPISAGLSVAGTFGSFEIGFSPRVMFVPHAPTVFLYVSIARAR